MATQMGLIEQPEASYLETEAIPDESLKAVASVPWVGIALAVHAILLMVAWFILPPQQPPVVTSVLNATTKEISPPPPPVVPPEKQVEFPKDSDVDREPVEDDRIPTDESDHAEDNTNDPNKDLAKNPNDNPSDNESPLPNKKSSTSAVGLAGGAGGGGGPGGEGGMFPHRPHNGRGIEHKDNLVGALDWLKDHQNREGYWSAANFGEDSSRKNAKHTYNIDFVEVGKAGGDAGWDSTCDVGLTGLSILAFTGAGYDHRSPGYGATLRNAAIWLRKVQDNDGCFGSKEDDHFVYNHAIATMAMAELFGLSSDRVYKPICERAVDFILKSQNPGLGWRYGIQPKDNDTSVTGWMVLTLHTCEAAGLHFDSSKCYADAAEWFDLMTVDVAGYPKTGYDTPGSNNSRLRSAQGTYDNNPSMDAICTMSMLFMGKRDLNDREIKSLAKTCIEKDFLPQWEHGKLDYYYWYYASLSLYQLGGSLWDQWEKAMVKTLIGHQRGFAEADRELGLTTKEVLDEHGSWDPVDAWGSAGGRVYATALNALTLETYYRYQRTNGKKKD